MTRLYTAQFSAVAVTAAQDLFEVLPATGKPVAVHGWSLFQTTDLKDAEEEVLRLVTRRGVGSTSGSGGSTPTPAPINKNMSAAGAVVEVNNTTLLASGTLTVIGQYGWNIRIPMVHFFTPETRPIIAPADYWSLRLEAAPADSVTISGHIWIEETT